MANPFALSDRVSRSQYVAWGVGLAVLKYGVEAVVLQQTVGRTLTLQQFAIPTMTQRAALIEGGPEWLGWAWFAWSLPFLWVALAMSVQRSIDAGFSPWWTLLILMPGVNVPMMIVFSLVSPREHVPKPLEPVEWGRRWTAMRAAVIGCLVGTAIAGVLLSINVFLLGTYGAALFLGTPVIAGAAAGFVFNLPEERRAGETFFVGVMTAVTAGLFMILFAVEGVICLAMAAPLATPLTGFGALIGRIAATAHRREAPGPMCLMFLAMPAWAGTEAAQTTRPEHVVTSSVEINAPPERVWNTVLNFPELPPAEEWYFRAGIATPVRAEIDGSGVGAVRRCVFSTGTFVEPITVWDRPHRLAFDVAEQPEPMAELSPYRHIHPPHLRNGLRSVRGEFRLIPLPGERTRLEGRTWYTLGLRPLGYWSAWSDLIIHRIHLRVLRHVARHAEAE